MLTCSWQLYVQEEVHRNEEALAYQVLPQDVSKQLLEMDVDDMQRYVTGLHLLVFNNMVLL